MSLRIGYITDERYPSVHADVQQVVKTADALGAEGCQVDLMPPRMARHLFMNRDARKQKICDFFNVSGNFNLVDILTWPASDLRIEKFFHGLAAPLRSLLGHYDVVYTRNLIPVLLASKAGLPVLFETYRALPVTDKKAWRVVKMAMTGSRFIGISTHSEYSRNLMIEAGTDPETIAAIPNGFDPVDFEQMPDRGEARARLGLPLDRKIAAYTGHIRPDKGVSTLLDLAEDSPDTAFVIVGGNPAEVDRLQSTLSSRNIGNVTLFGHVLVSQVPLYLAAADVLVLPPTAGPMMRAGRTVLPMKTFTYLAAGRPILAPDLPDTKGILVHESNCLRVEPDNRKAAAEALERLTKDTQTATRLGQQAASDSDAYTWRGRAARLVRFLEQRLAAQENREPR